ncbi:MAG: hypothetical protein M1818_001467 [Claussenomyces sp. TS43310]|nr:MAG: hypothetical protein M1818_001467 [Claussenomyces sp. TS43310]
MAMAIDSQQRQFGGLSFDHMPYSNPPQFTNPWTSTTSGPASTNHIYSPPAHGIPNLGLDSIAKQQAARNNVAMPSYASVPIATASAGSSLLADVYGTQDLLTISQDLLSPSRMQGSAAGYGTTDVAYTSAPPSSTQSGTAYVTASSTPYDSMGYAPAPVRSTYALQQQSQAEDNRRLSQPSVPSSSFLDSASSSEAHGQQHRQNSLIDFHDRGMAPESTRSFGDAIDASRGMIAMSQNTTPRNIYGPGSRSGRGSGDSYGFPSTHSTSSSISSSSTYPSYFGGSVDSSVSDYSNAGSDIESVSSRTLPRPSGLLNGSIPPAPQSMMGQFSSKVSSSSQKKHKCKVCDKRFTRPSSLQTHMYSHTGEKR